MPEINVRFRGDEGNRQAFFGALEHDPQRVVNAVQAANAQLLRARYNIKPLPNRAGTFLDVFPKKTEIDSVNNVIKQIGQLGYTIRQAIPTSQGTKFIDNFVSLAEVKEVQGNAKELIKAANEYKKAIEILEASEKRAATIPSLAAAREKQIRSNPRLANATVELDAARAERDTIEAQLKSKRQNLGYGGIVGQRAAQQVAGLEQQLLQNETRLTAAVTERNNARKQEERAIRKDIELNRLKAETEALNTNLVRQRAAVRAAEGNISRAVRSGVTSVPLNYQNLPQNLKNILVRGGLQQSPRYLQQQTFNDPRHDLRLDVTRFSGSFQRANGIVSDWTAEVDRNGKVVTRFGGQLSGASQVLKQITRDFQKVIEWTVATTIVFGALQYSIEQLRNLQELDFALTKFAITAQQSPQEAQESFGRLAQIAYSTATPLLEIVGAADDIALATQRAGQSTEEWQRQIFQLTESVGVFTNLTGIDTVQATDLLTATMKQLRLTAADIPAILSKITAVAGGQSQAISDITKGLSVMAEAGRVANLTVDEQIATVQVLSQVTSKTPAEVATAFKNLVGSLGSPAALKVLDEFNIAVRDPDTGGLRNILEIYKDINDAVKAGLIPAAELQRVIRGISGGPRRAPDAAALLAAIDQIAAAEQKSSQATNEAAIANAKAIDTTKAKFIQLQTTIDAVTFEKFGGDFKNLVGSLTDLFKSLLNAFNAIPTGLITGIIQIGLFFVAVRAGTRILGFLTSFLRETAAGFLQVGASANVAGQQLTLFNAKGQAISGGVGATAGGIRSNALRIGAGAGIGAGLTAASGGNLGQIVGGGLQGLGIGLLAFPSPDPITKIAGAVALLGGTLLQFFTATDKADEGKADSAIRILNSFANLKSASQDIELLDQSQEQLRTTIERLNGTANKSAEDYSLLESAQRDYADGLIATIDASQKAAAARKELIASLESSEEASDREIANELKKAEVYKGTSKGLEELIIKYQKVILQRANPDLVFPDFKSVPSAQLAPYAPATGSTIAETTTATGYLLNKRATPLDLTRLTEDANLVKKLFNDTGTSIVAQFEITRENLFLISNAINTLKESNDPLAASLGKTFAQFSMQHDAIIQTAYALDIYQSHLDALTFLNPEKASELGKLFNVVNSILSTQPEGPRQGPSTTGPPLTDLRATGLELLNKSFTGLEVPIEEVKAFVVEFFNTFDAEAKEGTTEIAFLQRFLEAMGYTFEELNIKGPQALRNITDAATDAGEALEKSIDSLRSGIAGRLAQAQADFQAGEIKGPEYTKIMADLNAYLNLVDTIGPRFKASLLDIGGFNEVQQELQAGFTDIIGLEDAASLSSDQFIERLLALGDTYGLNQKQLNSLALRLIDFHSIVKRLAELRVNIPIGVALDINSIRKAISVVKVALQASAIAAGIFGGTSNQNSSILQTLTQMESLLKSFGSTTNSIRNIYGSGSGSQIGTIPSGSTSTTKKTLDVSELDIPEEILQSAQMQEMIRQAIANARKLQSQIPGARKEAADDIVVLLDGLTKVMQVSGVKSEYLRKALEELAEIERKRLEFDTKADTIRRIRVGAGDFSAIANVPVNSTSGVSLGGAEGPINITLNLNGTVLTPAQLAQFADLVASALKRQIAGG